MTLYKKKNVMNPVAFRNLGFSPVNTVDVTF